MAISYPLVNGNRFDWSSVEIKFQGEIITGVKDVSYSHTLEPTKVYGTNAQPIGRTRGVYSADGSVTLYKSESKVLRQLLAGGGTNGYGEVSFDIIVNYAENGEDPIVDELIGCRIKGEESSHSQGADPLEEKITLDIMFVRRDGQHLVANPLTP